MRKVLSLLVALPLLVMFLGGCAGISREEIRGSVQKPPPVVEEPTYIFHQVMAGETMGTLAAYYAGNESLWREIALANPDLSPFNLKKGDVVKVPMAIATAHKEQPSYSTARKRVRKTTRKATTTPSGPAPVEEPASDYDDVPVFGPK